MYTFCHQLAWVASQCLLEGVDPYLSTEWPRWLIVQFLRKSNRSDFCVKIEESYASSFLEACVVIFGFLLLLHLRKAGAGCWMGLYAMIY